MPLSCCSIALVVLLSCYPFAPAFQSLSDAIASVAIHQSPVAVATVSIPQWCDCYWSYCPVVPSSFNPTVLRLPQSLFASRHSPSLRFQSHNGAIAANTAIARSNSILPRFNPTMVRLLRLSLNPAEWDGRSFNPTMVRLLP